MTDEMALAAKKKRVADLEAGNERSYEELKAEVQKMGGRYQMDTSDTRRELFFDKMVEWGLITEEQWLDFNIAFHLQVEEALNGAWEELREAKEEFKRRQNGLIVQKRPTSLLDSRGRPIGG